MILLFTEGKILLLKNENGASIPEFSSWIFTINRSLIYFWFKGVVWYHFRYSYMAFKSGFSRWGMLMNYFVHSFMYTYYTLRAMKIHVPKPVAMMITTMQIAQVTSKIHNSKITIFSLCNQHRKSRRKLFRGSSCISGCLSEIKINDSVLGKRVLMYWEIWRE